MAEKINDEELEKVINEINNNLAGRFFRGGGPKEEHLFTMTSYEKGIYIEFIGAFKEKAKSMRELNPLFEYIQRKGYKTNLD